MAQVIQFNEDGILSSDTLVQVFDSYELAGLQELRVRKLNELSSIDLGENGVLFSQGSYRLDDSTFGYKDARLIFANITAEMYARSIADKSILDALNRNKGFDIQVGSVTPDAIIPDTSVRGQIRAIEFKSTLGDFTEKKMETINDQVLKKYGSIGAVSIIYLSLNVDFPQTLKLPKPHRSLYYRIRNDLMKKRSLTADLELLRFDEGTSLSPGLDLIEKLGLVQDETRYLDTFVEYMPLDKLLFDTLVGVKRYERLFNHNYLEQRMAANIVFSPSIRKPNIFQGSLWNRSENKAKSIKNGGSSGDIGHRSAYLFHVPLFNTLKFTETEISEIAALTRSKDFDSYLGIPEMARLVKDVVRISFVYADVLHKIREVQTELAFLETEAKKVAFDDAEEVSIGRRIKEKVAEIDILKRVRVSDNDTTFKLTRSGYIRIPIKDELKYYTGIGRNFEKHSKIEIDTIDIENFDFDFESVLDNFGNLDDLTVDVQKPYGNHPSLLAINKAQDESLFRINEMWRSKIHWYLYNFWKVARAYIASYPGLTGRRTQSNDFRVIKVDDLPIYLMVSPSPNQISSGTIISISKHNLGTELPAFCLPHERYDVEGSSWFISKPFRLNRKILVKFDEVIGSFYGTCTLMSEYGVKMYNNAFYCSLYYNYGRQVSLALDAMYLLYKNSPNLGSLGRIEYADKFKELFIKDVRVAHIVKRLTKGYECFARQMSNYAAVFNQKILKQGRKDSVDVIVDPIFGIKIESMQTFLTLTYMKQIIPKNDGYDEAKVAGTFFEKELDFQSEYERSPFNDSLDYRKTLEVGKFNNMVLSEDDTSQEKISFHPDSCYRLVRDLVTSAFGDTPPMDPVKDMRAADTGKNTRVLIPRHLNRRNPKEEEELKTSYVGIESSNLTEALHIEIFNTTDWLRNTLPKMIEEKRLKLVIDDKDLEVTNLKLSHLITYELTNYPRHYFVIVKVKEQKGKDKRVFFVQNLFARNLNSFLDMSLDVLLRNTPEDIINQAGDEKNLTLERILRWGAADAFAGLIITEDQTRYGDLYPVQSFFVLIKALRDSGYLSDGLAKLFSVAISALGKRVILLPNSSMKEYVRYKQGKLSIEVPKEERLIRFFKKFEAFDVATNKLEGFEGLDPVWGKLFKENPSMRKDPGFILGVFNRLGSVFSSAHTRFMKLLLDKIGLVNIFQGVSHSDDSLKVTNTPRIKNSALNTIDISELLIRLGFTEGGEQIARIERRSASYNMVSIETGEFMGIVHADTIAKLLCVLSMMVPRFVGQRMSFTKWGVSSIGEILQTYCIAGKMIPPLIRYAAAIGADLPGKSPASDLNHAMSRIFQLYTGGLALQGVNDMMLMLNIYNYLRFGIKPTSENKYNRIPELGGYWYTFPYFLQTSGFLGNELRLYYLSSQDNCLGRSIKSQLMLMLNTAEVFAQVDAVDNEEQSSIEVGEPEGFVGAPETRKDFFIRFNRKSRTLMAFFRLFRDVRNQFKSWNNLNGVIIKKKMGLKWSKEFDEVGELLLSDRDLTKKEQTLTIRKLNNLFLDRSMSKTDDKFMKSISFLNRYITRSFQEGYARVPDGALLINRIGYLNRNFSNPFSTKFKLLHPELNDVKKFTVSKIWDTMVGFSNTESIPIENVRFYNLFRGLWSDFLFNISVTMVTLDNGFDRFDDRDLSLRWRRFSPGFNLSFLKTQSASLLIAAAIQKNWISPKSNLDLPIFKEVPRLRSDLGFSDTLDSFLDIVKRSGFSNEQLVSHASTLNRLFSSKLLITLSRFEGDDPQGRFITRNWTALTLHLGAKVEEIRVSDLKDLGDKEIGSIPNLRINSILISILLDDKSPLNRFSFEISGFENNVQSWVTREGRRDIPLQPQWQNFNLFLTREILKNINSPGSSSLKFYWDGRENGDIGCFYKGEYYFLSQTTEATVVNMKGYAGSTTNNNGREAGFMFKMMSYFLHRKKNRLTNFAKQCQGEGGTFRITEADELTIVGPRKLSTLHVRNFMVLRNFFFIHFNDRFSEFIDGALIIKNVRPNYIISPWRIPQDATGTKFFKSGSQAEGKVLIVEDKPQEAVEEERFSFFDDNEIQIIKLVMYAFSCLQIMNKQSLLPHSVVGLGRPKLSEMVYLFSCLAPFSELRFFEMIQRIALFIDNINEDLSFDEITVGSADPEGLINDDWRIKGYTFALGLSILNTPIRQFFYIHNKLAGILNISKSEVFKKYFIPEEAEEALGPEFNNRIMVGQKLMEKLYKPTLMLTESFGDPIPNSIFVLKAEVKLRSYKPFIAAILSFEPFPLLRHGRFIRAIGGILDDFLSS